MNSPALSLYPWQKSKWEVIVSLFRQNRLPHALLIAGPEENGKQVFAQYLANFVICRDPGNEPCGCCKDCLLYRAGTHPDIMQALPEDKHRQIKIDSVRKVVEFLSCHSNQGGYRVVIISPAEGMNIFSANALLKSLEEPGERTLILLVSQRVHSLMPTIRSRCQQLVFPVPSQATSLTWLQHQLEKHSQRLEKSSVKSVLAIAAGRPLTALRYVLDNEAEKWLVLSEGLKALTEKKKSVAEVSEQWKMFDAYFVFQWVIFLVAGMCKAKLTESNSLEVISSEPLFLTVVHNATGAKLSEYHDWLVVKYGQMTGKVNFNTQLVIESLLVRWQNISLS